jgi:hypothetical protein
VAARVLAAVLAVGLVLGGCAARAPTPDTESPAATPTSVPSTGVESANTTSPPSAAPTVPTGAGTLPPSVTALAPIPTGCSPSGPPDTMTVTNLDGFSNGVHLVGHSPVWAFGLPDHGVMHVPPTSGSDARFPNLKVMWIVGPDETQPVTIRGRERTTGNPLWFQVYPSNSAPSLPSSYTTTLTLDPATPNRGYTQNDRGNWSIWGIGVGARTAGCYLTTVSSSKGSWTMDLAVGG